MVVGGLLTVEERVEGCGGLPFARDEIAGRPNLKLVFAVLLKALCFARSKGWSGVCVERDEPLEMALKVGKCGRKRRKIGKGARK